MTNVAITDNLDAHLLYVAGSATLPQGVAGATVVYDPGTRTITWRIPSVPPGYRGQVGFLATVDPATPSDSTVPNVIAVASDQTPVPKLSNLVTSVVVEQPLRISKTASRAEAEIGDSVVYIVRVENSSATVTADNVVITDVLPFGFRYVKGTSVLDNAVHPGSRRGAPARHGRSGRWLRARSGRSGTVPSSPWMPRAGTDEQRLRGMGGVPGGTPWRRARRGTG